MERKEKFYKIVKLIIDKLEGGYYHPLMYKANPKKFALFINSGETMYGLDRHAGHDLYYSDKRKTSDVFKNLEFIPGYKYKTPQAQSFWNILDSAEASKNWPHNYNGGEFKEELTKLAADIIWPTFIKFCNKYLSVKAQQIIFDNNKLLFHFIYATWNGEGFFRYYAGQLENSIQQGKKQDELVNQAITLRENSKFSQIRSSGKKLAGIFATKSFSDLFKTDIKKTMENSVNIFIIAFLILSATFFI